MELEQKGQSCLPVEAVGKAWVFVTRPKCLCWCLTKEKVIGSWAVEVPPARDILSAVSSRRLPRRFTLSMGFWAEPPNRIWLLCIFLVPRDWPWLCHHHRVLTLSRIVLHILVVLTKCLWWRKLFEENHIMQEIIWTVLIYLINTYFIDCTNFFIELL